MTQDLPDTIAVFPLSGALLLPRAKMPLHIFEPRYLAMIEDCLKTPHRLIGMIQPASGPEGASARLALIGCAGRMTGFSETEDGRYMVTLTGQSRFRLGAEVGGGLLAYRRFRVDWHDFHRDTGKPEVDRGLERTEFMALITRFMRSRQLDADWTDIGAASDEMLINALSMLLPLSASDKQALLEAPDLSGRRETLTALISYELSSPPSGRQGGSDQGTMQ
jgi:Lon protease-like protein